MYFKFLIISFALLTLSCSQESEFTGKSRSKTKLSSSGDLKGELGDVVAGDFDGDGVSDTAGGLASVDGLAAVKHCDLAKERGYLKEATELITYDDNFRMPKQCLWDELINGQIRGQREEPKSFSVDSRRVICSMDLSSSKEIQFDDSIILSLNDNILFWGNVNEEVFEVKDNIYQYDWMRLKGSSMQSVGGGCVEGSTACEIPKHDVPGTLNISFSEAINKTIMQDVEEKGATFVLRSFGDNDDNVDCSHTEIDLQIKYTYFEK